MTTEVMSGIWNNRIEILLLLVKHTGWTLDICFISLLKKDKISKIVLYDNSGIETHSVNGGCCFTTYAYCYDQ